MASNIVFDGTKGISLPSFTTTEKNAIVSPATGAQVFDTDQNRQNIYAGGTWNAGLNSGTAVTASGTAIDFTGIPSWVKRVTVMFNGVSLATGGTANNSVIVQIGYSGGLLTTSSYLGATTALGAAASTTQYTTGFLVETTPANTRAYQGNMVLTNVSGNGWTEVHTIGDSSTTRSHVGGGYASLAGVLTQVRITTQGGTDTFDAGSINILYE